MMSTVRGERFGLAGSGFVVAMLRPSRSFPFWMAPVTDVGIVGTVAGQAGVPAGKYENVTERTGDPHVWQ